MCVCYCFTSTVNSYSHVKIVNLATLFLGRLRPKQSTCTEHRHFGQYPWDQWKGEMTVGKIS